MATNIRPITSLRQRCRASKNLGKPVSFTDDERGIAALEFAIIAPVILGVYLGLAELALVLSIDRQISQSASVAGDLATQTSKLETTDTADIVSAVLRVAGISNTSNYTLHLESFERDAGGTTTSLGSVVYNSSGSSWLKDVDPDGISNSMFDENSGIVIARVAYRYSPMGLKNTIDGSDKKEFLPSVVTLSETFMLKPRQSATIVVGAGTGTVITCTGSANNVSCSES